ncbi:hypothetical protein [Paenibacillus sp.]|uniref:hypothetical protein n=1 Tax=Paenibacillus sp. TaxID=58172 RepID=UPI00281118EB|nr:hypothetical protein [Paenibacillus sp.]
MKRLHPITPETCSPYVGKTVCAVLHDGTQVVGTISRVTANGIEINGSRSGASVLSTRAPVAKKQLQRMASKANTKAFGYGYPGYGYPGYGYGFGFEWAAIALLFLLPFLFY